MKKVKIVYLRVISCTCRTVNVTVSIFVMCINGSEKIDLKLALSSFDIILFLTASFGIMLNTEFVST